MRFLLAVLISWSLVPAALAGVTDGVVLKKKEHMMVVKTDKGDEIEFYVSTDYLADKFPRGKRDLVWPDVKEGMRVHVFSFNGYQNNLIEVVTLARPVEKK